MRSRHSGARSSRESWSRANTRVGGSRVHRGDVRFIVAYLSLVHGHNPCMFSRQCRLRTRFVRSVSTRMACYIEWIWPQVFSGRRARPRLSCLSSRDLYWERLLFWGMAPAVAAARVAVDVAFFPKSYIEVTF